MIPHRNRAPVSRRTSFARRQRRFESEKHSVGFLRTVTCREFSTSSAINATVYRARAEPPCLASSRLAWEFFVARRYISGGISRADTSSREARCVEIFDSSLLGRRKSYVMAPPLARRSEKGIRRDTANGRTGERTWRRPFRRLKQSVKVSGMRFLRSQI